MYGYIYKITNKINEKIYIGKHKYISDEVKLDEDYICSGVIIKPAINKYGIENFTIEMVDIAQDLLELNEKEKYYIKYFDCRAPKGYNLTDGGDGLSNPDEETKYKCGSQWRGKTQPKEMVDKRVKKFKEKGRTKEWNENIRAALKSSEKLKNQLAEANKIRLEKHADCEIYTDGVTDIFIKKGEIPPEGLYKFRTATYRKIMAAPQEEIINYYKDHSIRQTIKEFGINRGLVEAILKFNNINLRTKSESQSLANIQRYHK